MKPAVLAYLRADSVDTALMAMTGGLAKACGGTQSLGAMLNLRLAQPGALVDVSSVPALGTVAEEDGRLVIGAAVTHARIEDDADGRFARASAGLLPSVAAGIAYRAVRQRGTLGGSLAHADPAADWVNTACLLGAGLRVQGPAGARRIDAAGFFLGPFTTALAEDELIVAVDWPLLAPTARWSYRKQCRKPGEFAEALVAGWRQPGSQRLLLGALNGAPYLLAGADEIAALRARSAQTALFDDLGLDDPYQRQLLSVLLGRVMTDLELSA